MRGGGQHRVVAAPDQLREARLTGQIGAQHHRVDEVPHQRLQFGPGASGKDGADRQIGLAGVAVQHGQQGGVQQGQQRHLVRAGVVAPGRGELVGQSPPRRGAGAGGVGRPGPVGR